MKKLSMVALAAGIACTSLSAMAADEMNHETMTNMSQMDTNHDGMISKDEYMQYHEAMWEKMPKNSSGMVEAKGMRKMMEDNDQMNKGPMKSDTSTENDMSNNTQH